MSSYTSADVLLAEARLRLDSLGRTMGVVVVEGNDDLRIFYRNVFDPAQILPTGGRTLLLAALEKASPVDRERMIFVTDCDYAVRRGELVGCRGLAITSGTDVESDLLELGLLAPVVAELVPSALPSRNVSRIASETLQLARRLSLPVGRVRMAVQPLGIDLGFDHLEFSKYWVKATGELDVDKLVRVMSARLRSYGYCGEGLSELVAKTPSDEGMCHGKDLISAIRTILIHDYRVDQKLTVLHYASMLRLALDPYIFEHWAIVQRIRDWESTARRRVLRASGA